MSDYISREDAEKVFSQPVTMSMCLTLEECKQKNAQRQIDLFVIRGLPAADVRPVRRGKWKPRDFTYGRSYYFCSACEETVDMPTAMGIPMFRYCPNCGAWMEES